MPSLNSVIDSDAAFALAASIDLLLAAASPTVADALIAHVMSLLPAAARAAAAGATACSDSIIQAATSPIPLLAHPQQQVALLFSGVGYIGDASAPCASVIAPSSAPPPPLHPPSGIDLLVNSSAGTVAIRTQPNPPQLAGALNVFQATLCLSSASSAALYVDIDVLTFLQRARAVPSPPNASSPTAAVSPDASARAIVFTGQTHVITIRSSSALQRTLRARAGIPASCSIAAVHRLSPTEWCVSVSWPVCNSDLGTVHHSPCPPPLGPRHPSSYSPPHPPPSSHSHSSPSNFFVLVSIAHSALRQISRGARLCARLVGWTPVVSSR